VPVFALTTTELFALQPFDGSVTIKLYVPAVLTVGVGVEPPETIPGPVQLKVAPAVADDPLSITLVDEHVIVCVVPAFASGAVVFELTVTLLFAVQPLDGSVTVSWYDPAALTVGDAVLPPETMPGPVQLKVAPDVEEDPFRIAVPEVQLIV
jgi:hypothetical protein